MSGLYHAHSGIRYLVLLLAFANLALLVLGLVQKKPFGKVHRVLGAIFTGTLHLQLLLGIGMVVLGRYYPALVGHIMMMVVAAVTAQVTMSLNRRRPEPGFVLPLVGAVVALLCITGGLMAIGRGLFQALPYVAIGH